jgi:hypothetical protein
VCSSVVHVMREDDDSVRMLSLHHVVRHCRAGALPRRQPRVLGHEIVTSERQKTRTGRRMFPNHADPDSRGKGNLGQNVEKTSLMAGNLPLSMRVKPKGPPFAMVPKRRNFRVGRTSYVNR